MTDKSPDIAIIGGGIAGLYCCCHIAKHLPDKKVTLYEATDRLGGRIETWSLKRKYDSAVMILAIYSATKKTMIHKNPTTETHGARTSKDPITSARSSDRCALSPSINLCSVTRWRTLSDSRREIRNLVAFPPYAAEDPEAPKFTLVGEECDQKTLLDLLLLAIRRICELLQIKDGNEDPKEPDWNNSEAQKCWVKFQKTNSIDRHYWQGHLLDWINRLDDGSDRDKTRQKETGGEI